MKIYSLPRHVRGIIFDIDSTLYRNDEYVRSQTRVQLERLAGLRGISYEELKKELRDFQTAMAEVRGGHKPSLANTLKEGFGISIETSVKWREELLEPEKYLIPDQRLRDTLEILSSRCRLAALTNNPSSVGRRTLSALGVEDLIPDLIGLEETGMSKPVLEPFRLIAARMNLDFSEMINVGDRWHVDLELPLSAGLGGVLVESMDDVYTLPGILP